jgi:hypothetical protein
VLKFLLSYLTGGHTMRLTSFIMTALLAVFVLTGCGLSRADVPVTFEVRIENISQGTAYPVLLAPGVWTIQDGPDALFMDNQPDRGAGLEALAEDGNPADLSAALVNQEGISASGVFNTPEGAGAPGPLASGSAYVFRFDAMPGQRLSFATMFVQSNDLFYAPDDNGIELFNFVNRPLSGDITAQIDLWDAGTEVNQEPGVGSEQAPRQTGPDMGASENGIVHLVNDSYSYPSVNSTVRVTITPQN